MAEGITTTLNATGSSPRVSAAVDHAADLAPFEALGIIPGSITPPTFVQLPDIESEGKSQGPWGEIVGRIWVVPSFLRPVNPALLTDIPFDIWQTHPVANTLSSISGTGHTGLTLDITPPVAFNAYERKTVNIQITAAAPPEVQAVYDFNFSV